MPPADYHQLLSNQISEAYGVSPEISGQFSVLLQKISDSYKNFDANLNATKKQFDLRTSQLIASTSNAYSFLDSLNMGFIMCDINAEVVLTNQSVRRILVINASDNDASRALDTKNESWTIDAIDALFKPALELKELVRQCLQSSRPLEKKELNFGKSVLHLFVAPMINETSSEEKQQIGVVILLEDITEQKVLERSKDEFLSIASHELRTPLTAIRGNAALIKKYYGDKLPNSDTVEMIDDIHESSMRLIEIVNDFLDVSAIEQGKMQMNPAEFRLEDVVTDVMREMQTICEPKGVALIIDQSIKSAPLIKADKQRIKQVLYNLVGNAAKFTNDGNITISCKIDGVFVNTSVADTGKGISLENQHLLFRKFQQAGSSLLTRDNTKGTGLGLYISKLIVELSGGKIWLDKSEPNKGSTFSFSLPRILSN